MNKETAILGYKTAMSVFKGWRQHGWISDEELSAIDTMLARKYGLSSCSIYRENDLLFRAKRVIYGSTKGDAYEKDYNEN
jgi:hypothetical protein